jgi:hypothetical protein
MAADDLLFPQPPGSAPHAYRAKVTVFENGDRRETLARNLHAYILASMVSNLEKAFTISPASKPFDRAMWLVHFGPQSGQDIKKIMMAAYDGGKHVMDHSVTYEEIHGVRIEFEEDDENGKWRQVCIDGKIIMVEKGGWMEIRKVEKGGECLDILA